MRVALLIYLGWVLIASVVAAALIAWDKRAAVKLKGRRGRRISEKTLHLWELAGGFPGAFIARRQTRHKTRKVSYRVWAWVCTVVHVGVAALIAGSISR